MKFTIIILLALLCMHTLSVYGMKDKALVNAKKKEMHEKFQQLQTNIERIGKNLDYNNEKVNQKINNFVNANMDDMVKAYSKEIKKSLKTTGFFEYAKTKTSNSVPEKYNLISKNELEYYKEKLEGFRTKNIYRKDMSINLSNAIENDPETKKNAINYSIIFVKTLLVERGILKPKPNTKVSIINRMKSKIKGLMTKLRVTEHSKPIMMAGAGLSAIAGIGGISYGIGHANAMKNMTKDIKDHTSPHMSLFGILVILCSVVATLALCVIVAYHIMKKREQPDISYSVIGLM